MSIRKRNNVQVHGTGPATLVLAHGFGCNQNVWQRMLPFFADRYRMVTFDLVGSGGSDGAAYSRAKYGALHGYADDLLEVMDAFCDGPCIYVGHSVSAMIGMLATIRAPQRFMAQVMVGPSPCYINDGDYAGGFARADIDELLDAMAGNYLGWSSSMAPTLMGTDNGPALGSELTMSFSNSDPAIARHFAEVTFLSDHRADLPRSSTPTLILQSTQDPVVPLGVGTYLHQHIANSTLAVIENIGHYPHMSAPLDSAAAMSAFLHQRAL
ncbi:alpha/beta fold hydrolase [Massilia sp. S19_KUP03_FR1]|uniref:alpha/beta fold hydrolase n=1 Tax=Massilia sp. S19_KUP03_FR1 TaxID=3025503 RepID=UPI002FCDAA10